jgi:hypothetical protein
MFGVEQEMGLVSHLREPDSTTFPEEEIMYQQVKQTVYRLAPVVALAVAVAAPRKW